MPTLAKKELEVSIDLYTLKDLLDKKVPAMDPVPSLKFSAHSDLDFKLVDKSPSDSRHPSYMVKDIILQEKGMSDKNTVHRDWIFSLEEVQAELLAYAKERFKLDFSTVKVDYILLDNSDGPGYNPHVASIKLFLNF